MDNTDWPDIEEFDDMLIKALEFTNYERDAVRPSYNSLYIMGSMRNPLVQVVANRLRTEGYNVFDDWQSPGPEADDHWKAYSIARGQDYLTAIRGKAAQLAYNFDKDHLDASDVAILVAPAGKSAHMEVGYMVGRGKPVFILHDDPDRWDIMYQFVFETGGDIVTHIDDLIARLKVLNGTS